MVRCTLRRGSGERGTAATARLVDGAWCSDIDDNRVSVSAVTSLKSEQISMSVSGRWSLLSVAHSVPSVALREQPVAEMETGSHLSFGFVRCQI